MEIRKQQNQNAIRLAITKGKKEIARAYLYLIKNDLHKEPYGLLEDVFVEEKHRGQGLGTKIVRASIAEAKKRGCYKFICTSQSSQEVVHRFYEKLGLKKYGYEFRMDLDR